MSENISIYLFKNHLFRDLIYGFASYHKKEVLSRQFRLIATSISFSFSLAY